MIVYPCVLGVWEVEAGNQKFKVTFGYLIQGQSGLFETLSLRRKPKDHVPCLIPMAYSQISGYFHKQDSQSVYSEVFSVV